MNVEINYSKQAIKFLQKQSRSTKERIVTAINSLPNGDVKNFKVQIQNIDFVSVILELYLIDRVIYYISKK